MEINEEYNVTIEKMINEGKALARVSGFPVFIENAAPLDELRIKVTKLNKSYALGEIKEIIKPSKFRVKPLCALHNVCGSCDWQYISYEEQLKQKENIIRETLSKYITDKCEFAPIIPSPKNREYRCKIQYPVSQTKNSKRILTGYYKKHSHELVNIKYCPMNPEIINEINENLKTILKEYGITAYNEKTGKGLLRHIIYRVSSDIKQILVIFVVNSEKYDKKFINIAKYLKDKYPEITGVCVNYNTKKGNVITGEKTEAIIGNDYYVETLSDIKYKVSQTGFFQVNPYCAEKIFEKVKELIVKNTDKPSVLDAYSGVSAFGVWISNIAQKVVSIEEVKSASEDAKENSKLNNINNLEIVNGDAAKEFEKLIKEGEKFDVSVTDPPRKGCSEDSVNYLCELTSKYIIYVSCNVATLARDLKLFEEKGFKPIYVRGADMFPNTYHVETICLMEKE